MEEEVPTAATAVTSRTRSLALPAPLLPLAPCSRRPEREAEEQPAPQSEAEPEEEELGLEGERTSAAAAAAGEGPRLRALQWAGRPDREPLLAG